MAEPYGDSKIVEADAHHLEGANDITNEKFPYDSVEAAKHELNRIDLDQLSKDALTIKSRAARRLAVVIMIQGLSKLLIRSTSIEVTINQLRRVLTVCY